LPRLHYLKQVEICESVRKAIIKAITDSNDPVIRAKISRLPATESILRIVSLSTILDTEVKLKDFIRECIINDLHLTGMQIEYLRQNLLESVPAFDAARSL
jgi:hypothetical protein